jgi:hypothetical protein
MSLIDALDDSLDKMIRMEAPAKSLLAQIYPSDDSHISFAMPDATWRQNQNEHGPQVINMYLYRVLENRELRSNARRRQPGNGIVTQQLFPARIECSYVASAWSFAATPDPKTEHQLLSDLLGVMLRNPTIPLPYLSGDLASSEIPPPVISAGSEDMAAKPDFWNSLGTPVRPSITCHVAVEMDLGLDATSAALSTIKSLLKGGDQTSDGLFMIAGTISSDTSPPAPIANAWILVDSSPQVYLSDSQGRFVIERISAGAHTMEVRAVGFQEKNQGFNVPGSSETYNLSLTRT